MKEQPAFVGGIVHFVWPGPSAGKHMAAIIINTWQSLHCRRAIEINRLLVALTVFNTMGETLLIPNADYDEEEKRPGTWHWPEDVVPQEEETGS